MLDESQHSNLFYQRHGLSGEPVRSSAVQSTLLLQVELRAMTMPSHLVSILLWMGTRVRDDDRLRES